MGRDGPPLLQGGRPQRPLRVHRGRLRRRPGHCAARERLPPQQVRLRGANRLSEAIIDRAETTPAGAPALEALDLVSGELLSRVLDGHDHDVLGDVDLDHVHDLVA